MGARRQSRLVAALRWLSQERFMEGVAIILGLASAGLGFTFIVSPEQNASSRGFSAAMAFLDPIGWACLFVGGSLLLIALVIKPGTRRDAMWPALVLMLTHGGIALAFLLTVGRGAVPTGVWAYSGLCALAAWLTIACAFTREDQPHAAPSSRLADHA